MPVYRVTFERYIKATDEMDWGQLRSAALVDALNSDHAEEMALAKLQSGDEGPYIRFEWCGTSLIGE